MDSIKRYAEEQARFDFDKSQEKRHYPDDEFYKAVEEKGFGQEYMQEYMNVWRELWEEKYDLEHSPKKSKN